MSRNKFMLISFTCFLISFGIAYLAWADSEMTVGTVVASGGSGFDAGAGAFIDGRYRWDHFGVYAGGAAMKQKKSACDSGYRWNLFGELRGYMGDWYLAHGVRWAGYKMQDPDWEKDAWYPTLSIGYDSNKFDCSATYFFEERQTPNKTSAFGLKASYVIWRCLKLLTEVQFSDYLQGEEEKHSSMVTGGVGWQF
jgi:hypothetical protein